MSPTSKHHTAPVTTTIIPALRAAAIKVRIKHSRYLADAPYSVAGLPPLVEAVRRRGGERISHRGYLPKGGQTTVDLLFPDGSSYSAIAKCSLEDRFNRKEGIRLALSRALAERKYQVEVAKVKAYNDTLATGSLSDIIDR